MTTPSDKHPLARALGILLPLLILASAIGVSVYLVKTKPKPVTRPPQESAALVEVMTVNKTNAPIRVRAAGTVIPATEITLQPEVSGRISTLHPSFEPGATFRKGDVLLEIDSRDYSLVVASRKADLARVEAAYRLELGYQDVARHEWEMIPDLDKATDLDRELALRKPQLLQAEANRDAALAALKQAELNLERTTVRAPFNGVVRERLVNVGAQVSSQNALATIAGTDAFWVRITVPVSDLQWIRLPNDSDSTGSPVALHNTGGPQGNPSRQGHVIRRLPDLENAGRMAQLLVTVPKPMDTSKQPLLLGAYVDVTIEGCMAKAVIVVPRASCREGNVVWVRDADKRMRARTVEPLWGNQHEVYLRAGLDDGEQIVTSDLGAPVEGMKLTTAGDPLPSADNPAESQRAGNRRAGQ